MCAPRTRQHENSGQMSGVWMSVSVSEFECVKLDFVQ